MLSESQVRAEHEFAAMLEHMRPGALAVLRHRFGRGIPAEDIFSDAVLVTLRRLREGTIEDPDKLPAFVGRTAHNLAIAELRKRKRQATEADGNETLARQYDPAEDAAGQLHREACARAVRALMQQMPIARDRKLLVRYELNGEDKDSICRDLGLGEAHFNRVIFRARARLRELLERRGLQADDLLGLALLGACTALLAGFFDRP